VKVELFSLFSRSDCFFEFDKSVVISWRFVNANDVRPGVWLKCDEQALVYLAMHESDSANNKVPRQPAQLLANAPEPHAIIANLGPLRSKKAAALRLAK
jgi:hypothetical protein